MALVNSGSGNIISNGQVVQDRHVANLLEALNGSGSFEVIITGSLNSNPAVASFVGTASWALSASQAKSSSLAQSASFVTASNVYGPYGSNSILSASYSVSASYVVSASYATSASRAISSSFATTASYVVSASYALSSSFATTASYVVSASYAVSASRAVSASIAQTASFVTASNVFGPFGASSVARAQSASYVDITSSQAHVTVSYAGTQITISVNTGSGGTGTIINGSDGQFTYISGSTLKGSPSMSYTLAAGLLATGSFLGNLTGTASWANSASQAITASYARTASYVVSSSYASTASFVVSSSYAISASFALSSSLAVSASYATTSSFATSASVAVSSSFATSASVAVSSSFATSASRATSSSFATTASYISILPGTNVQVNYTPAGIQISSSAGGGGGVDNIVAVGSTIQLQSASVNVGSALTVPFATSASYITASNVFGPYGSNSVISASYAISSSRAVSASYSISSSYSVSSSFATSASYAVSSSFATNAIDAVNATNATNATKVNINTPVLNTNYYVNFADNTSGNEEIYADTDLAYNPFLNTLTAPTFSGNLVGTASQAITASYALNGGVTSIIAGSGISIDQTTGAVTITNTGTGGGGGSGATDITASSATQIQLKSGSILIGNALTVPFATTASYVGLSGLGITVNGTALTASLRTVNATLPDANGNVGISITSVTTGLYINRPTVASDGEVYIVSGDVEGLNGDTYIYETNTAQWYQIAPLDQTAADLRYLKLAGGTMVGNITMSAGFTLIGSSSYATSASQALSSSFATTASYVNIKAGPRIQAVNYNGSEISITGSIGGSNTQIQFNSGSTFNGSSDLIWDYTNRSLNLSTGANGKFITFNGGSPNPSAYISYGSSIPSYGGLRVVSYRNSGAGSSPFTFVSTTNASNAALVAGFEFETQFSASYATTINTTSQTSSLYYPVLAVIGRPTQINPAGIPMQVGSPIATFQVWADGKTLVGTTYNPAPGTYPNQSVHYNALFSTRGSIALLGTGSEAIGAGTRPETTVNPTYTTASAQGFVDNTAMYFGSPGAIGSWRIILSGSGDNSTLNIERWNSTTNTYGKDAIFTSGSVISL